MTTTTSNKMTAYIKPLTYITLTFALAGYSSLSSADAARAIQLKDVQGKVMVNTGAGYVAGNSGMVLRPGYKVMLSDKAQAKILYGDNCSQTLKGNSLIKVSAADECKSNMFDEKSFTKTAALGDVAVQQPAAVNNGILVWSATLGVTVVSQSNKNNSNQSPNASAF